MKPATSKMSDNEDYLIKRIVSFEDRNLINAKAWMLFAKSLYSDSFPILFQAYKMEREQKNLQRSASCLTVLLKKFPHEKHLVKELKNISNALCCDSDSFSKQLFNHLSDDTKYEVMLIVTHNVPNVEEHCELMLLFLKRMPNSRLLQHGGNIIDTLLNTEERSEVQTPVNLYRKMLVCDALPLILKVSPFEYKSKDIFRLLQKAIEFYICCIMAHPTPQEILVRESISNVLEQKWKPLLKLFETVAILYKWNYPEMFVTNFNELSFQQLLSLLKRRNKTLSDLTNGKSKIREESYEEAYLCLVVIFFYYLHHFGQCIHPNTFGTVSGPYNYVLMEGIAFSESECSTLSSDFKRSDRGYIAISRNTTFEVNDMLIPSFMTAAESWELIHQHPYFMKEFECLCKNIQLRKWPVFQEFYVDLLIYQGAHREVIGRLMGIRDRLADATHRCKIDLQIASCYQFNGECEKALKILFDVILSLSHEATYEPKSSLSKCSLRYVYFMGCNNKDILQYCIALILKIYKCRSKIDSTYGDLTVGYLFVLMQYDFDCEYDLFHKCMVIIKSNKSFCFQKFFNYIIHVDILEEFAHLATSQNAGIELDILITSSYQANKQRAITRGVNKGAKDDLKHAFVNQMMRCSESLDNLFIDFLTEEHSLLLLTLFERG